MHTSSNSTRPLSGTVWRTSPPASLTSLVAGLTAGPGLPWATLPYPVLLYYPGLPCPTLPCTTLPGYPALVYPVLVYPGCMCTDTVVRTRHFPDGTLKSVREAPPCERSREVPRETLARSRAS